MKTLRLESMDGSNDLTINYRIDPTSIQQIIYEDSRQLLQTFGGEYTGCIFNEDGQRVHFLIVEDDLTIARICTIKFNDEYIKLN